MIDGVGLVVCLVRFECLVICHGSPFQISVTSTDVYLHLLPPTQPAIATLPRVSANPSMYKIHSDIQLTVCFMMTEQRFDLP